MGGSNIVSVALSQAMSGGHHQQPQNCFTLASSGNGGSLHVLHPNDYSSFQTNNSSSVTVDLPSMSNHGGHQSSEENGVLLCNLDDLSRYIPENFYSDFTLADSQQQNQSDYLQTVVAGKATTTTSNSIMSNLHHQQPQQPQSITIQLPTQPQPIQGVKTVTYVNQLKANNNMHMTSPGKVTQYAYTPSGERIAIHGLPPEATKPGSTLQVQVKGGGMQTLQLSALEPSASKLTVLQEFPEGSKVVQIQDKSNGGNDSISSILEEMKAEADNNEMAEYATAIPVAVTSLDNKKTTIKRVGGGQNSTVFLPTSTGNVNKRIIFAGNTLPQGAIPIQINGLNAIPITAVKSIPFSLSTLTNSISPTSTSTVSMSTSPKKASPSNSKLGSGSKVNKQVNNNGFNKVQSNNLANINKAIGNNKTCNWVFENGEVCGKTFSKSYNLVVHMRMHEDVRPFGCSLCDQTFRQKAHLQRHETTHGIGVKVSNRGQNSSGNTVARRKRKRSSRGSTGSTNGGQLMAPLNSSPSVSISTNLQQRLARVSEQFGTIKDSDIKDSEEELEDEDESSPAPKLRRLSVRLDRCEIPNENEDSSNPNDAFQPYIATAEEVAAATRTSPQVLDAAVTAAVNEAISDIQEAIM